MSIMNDDSDETIRNEEEDMDALETAGESNILENEQSDRMKIKHSKQNNINNSLYLFDFFSVLCNKE